MVTFKFADLLQNRCSQVCLRPATLSKKRLQNKCFPVNFVKFLRAPFLTEHLFLQNLQTALPSNKHRLPSNKYRITISDVALLSQNPCLRRVY